MPNEIKVLSARAVKSAVSAIAEDFTRASGCAVMFDFAPVGAIEKKLANGERGDVVILSTMAVDKLEQSGQLVAGSRRVLGRTSIGVAVRDGAPLPDVSSPEAFRALLLSVDKISVSDVVVGGTAARYLPKLFERMGISDALEPKLIRCAGGDDVAERVVRGEATIGMTFISEILAVRGASVAGALPQIYGNDTVYCAAVMKTTDGFDFATRFIAALIEPQTRETWRRAGFEIDLAP
ncbi:MAG: molybdate ABC transporter substrate-binding protein [Xanthobacteraceae bacterium]